MLTHKDVIKLIAGGGCNSPEYRAFRKKAFRTDKKYLKKALQSSSVPVTDHFDLTNVEITTDWSKYDGVKLFDGALNLDTINNYIRSDIFFAGTVPVFNCTISYIVNVYDSARSYYGDNMDALSALKCYSNDINDKSINTRDDISIKILSNYHEKLNKLNDNESATVGYIELVRGTYFVEIVVTKGNDYVTLRTIDRNVINDPGFHFEADWINGGDINFVSALLMEDLTKLKVSGTILHDAVGELCKLAEPKFKMFNLSIDTMVFNEYCRYKNYAIWYSLMLLLINPTIKQVYNFNEVSETIDLVNETEINNEYHSSKTKKLESVRYHTLNGIGNVVKNNKIKLRHCMLWPVHGHFRHYKKSGKTIFIQPYWKGELREAKKKEVEPNKYKI